MTLNLEHIIARILSEKPELTKEDLMKAIEKKVKLASGFLTWESAALSLAAELGIIIEPSFKHEMLIKDLVSGLHDVTVSGRVIYISHLKRFKRPDGRERTKRSIYIADKTGVIKVALWNNIATSINPESLIDRIVRLSHFSVRRRIGGSIELNAGPRSTIEIEMRDFRNEDYPPIALFMKRINELHKFKGRLVDVLGLIEHVYPITVFKRQNGSEGKVRRADISDKTGKITLVLWDESVNFLLESHTRKYAVVFGVRVKERFNKKLELHSGNKTQIIVTEKEPSGF